MQKTAIIKLKGGMGNQMFQYAFSRALLNSAKARADTLEIKYDVTGYTPGGRVKIDTLRTFDLQKLSCELPLAGEEEALAARNPFGPLSKLLRRASNKILKPDTVSYNQKLLILPYQNYYEGYWQSEKYFKDIELEIRKHFAFKEPLGSIASKVKEQIQNDENAVGIFFRRTDYVGHSDLDVCDEAYYDRALAKMRELVPNIRLYVMSDNIEWVKANAKLPSNVVYVSSPEISYVEEMELSTACKHHIIPNSTFAWWGAWLNTNANKIVITPKLWSRNHNDDWYRDIVPAGWIRV